MSTVIFRYRLVRLAAASAVAVAVAVGFWRRKKNVRSLRRRWSPCSRALVARRRNYWAASAAPLGASASNAPRRLGSSAVLRIRCGAKRRRRAPAVPCRSREFCPAFRPAAATASCRLGRAAKGRRGSAFPASRWNRRPRTLKCESQSSTAFSIL